MKKRWRKVNEFREAKVSKEDAFPFLLKVGGLFLALGGLFLALGGLISGAISVGVVSVKSFFHLKERVDNKFQKKYVELKIKS